MVKTKYEFVSFVFSSYILNELGRTKDHETIMIILIKQWLGSIVLGYSGPQRILESGLICTEERKYSDLFAQKATLTFNEWLMEYDF